MRQENSQLDIPDRQLLASSAQPSVWTEIGEAQVTHTIFGRAKVRIVRKHDNVRRALWRTLVVVIIAVSAWQGWVAYQPSEPQQSSDSLPPASSSNPESAPALKSEIIAPAVTPLEVKSAPVAAAQTEIHKPMNVQKRAPQQPIGLNGAEQKSAKPVTAQPKPVTEQPLTANKPLPPRLSPTSHPAVATSRPALPAVQPAASSPSAVPTLTSPMVKEDASTQSPAGDDQPAAPAITQGK